MGWAGGGEGEAGGVGLGDIDGLLLMHAGNVAMIEAGACDQLVGLRARVATGPEPDAQK